MRVTRSLCAIAIALGLGCCDADLADTAPSAEPAEVREPEAARDDEPNGEELYETHCVSCHGVEAEGTDICVSLITPHINMQSDGKLFVMIKSGTGGQMPSFGDVMRDDEIIEVIGYLRSIQDENGHEGEGAEAGE